MTLIVQKYGGTSVGTPERIRRVARRVADARARGDQLVVVVSAMGHSTDELLNLAGEVIGGGSPARDHPREMDMLLTAGERISMALLAMAIRAAGAEARSFTGSQAAILTDGSHTTARIREVRPERVQEALDTGCVAIVAGFQGVSPDREVTTLGRGGSDTTAVALAAALGADRCDIFTDVEGVFTADPRRVPEARVVPRISYTEMLEMASAGAQVMHPRAVEIGARFGVEIRVRSSFEEGDDPTSGTLITQNPQRMEELLVTGIASAPAYAKLTLHGLPAGTAVVSAILSALADAGVSVDMIFEATDRSAGAQLQLTVAEDAVSRARRILGEELERLGGAGLEVHGGLSRITLVGSGMTGRPGVYARAFRALVDAEVEVHAISTSAISIAVLVPAESETRALGALHRAFALDGS